MRQVFTPDAVDVGDRFDYWVSVTRKVFWPLVTRMRPAALTGASVNWDTCGRLELSTVSAGPHSVTHTVTDLVASPADTLCLALQVDGTGVIRQDGRECALTRGDASFFDPRRPYTMSFGEEFSLSVFSLPRDLVRSGERRSDRITARTLAPSDPVAASALSYLACVSAVSTQAGLTDQSLSNGAVGVAATLIRGLLGTSAGRGGAAELLDDAEAFIDLNLHHPSLAPRDIAAACHLSLRQLYRIFGDTGRTVAATIRQHRLSRARALLESLPPDVPVHSVGTRVGFASNEQFTRVFHDAYGLPPAAWRAARYGRDPAADVLRTPAAQSGA